MYHLLSAQQFESQEDLLPIFEKARFYKSHLKRKSVSQTLKGMIIATLFFEASTRTRLSFETAALRLGAQIISCENAFASGSAAKGESIEDTAKVLSGYADLLVIRHPEKQSAQKAADVSNIPVINAGDGDGEHPTQALLDLFTIYENFGRMDNLVLSFAGDLKHSRTMHSTILLASKLENITINLIAPQSMSMDSSMRQLLEKSNAKVNEYSDWNSVLGNSDVLYTNRVQKERFKIISDYEMVKNSFILTQDSVRLMKPSAIILNPLPRINEIATEVDADHRAMYFEQAHNGVFVRMAILDTILNKKQAVPIAMVTTKKIIVPV